MMNLKNVRKVLIAILLYTNLHSENNCCFQALLNKYSRPVTVLEIGFNKVEDTFFHHNSKVNVLNKDVFVLFSPEVTEYNFEDCTNTIALSADLKLKTLIRFSEVENIDITVIHQADSFYDSMKEDGLKAALNLGPFVLLYFPNKKIRASVAKKIAQLDASTDQAYFFDKNTLTYGLFVHVQDKQYVQRQHWLEVKKKKLVKTHTINTNFEKKQLVQIIDSKLTVTNKWIPGINLITFKICEGIWPSIAFLTEFILNDLRVPHPDWYPNNMIVQGDKVALIDFTPAGKPKAKRETRKNYLDKLKHWLSLTKGQDARSYFWQTLHHSPGKIKSMQAGEF